MPTQLQSDSGPTARATLADVRAPVIADACPVDPLDGGHRLGREFPVLRARQPHHADLGYRNLYASAAPEEDEEWSVPLALDAGLGAYAESLRPLRPDGDFLRRNRDLPTLTWLGHSTFLVQIGGLNILTDPHLGQRASALPFLGPKRVVPPALHASQLPPIHAVVLSHDHYDHLDRRTLNRLIKQKGGPPQFFVPLGLKGRLHSGDYPLCTELDWWQWAQLSRVILHCVPAHHESGRLPWEHDGSLWCGWVIEHGGFRFYFAGDTGYSPALLEIGRRFPGLNLAALPIAGHASRWRQPGMMLSPEAAVRIHREIGARRSVAMHWGSFAVDRQPLAVPPRRLEMASLAAGLFPDEFQVMRVGQTLSLHTYGGLESLEEVASSRSGPERAQHLADAALRPA